MIWQVLLSHARAHHAPSPQVHLRIVQRIVEIREQPPENPQRTPGPRAILSYLRTIISSGSLQVNSSCSSYAPDRTFEVRLEGRVIKDLFGREMAWQEYKVDLPQTR